MREVDMGTIITPKKGHMPQGVLGYVLLRAAQLAAMGDPSGNFRSLGRIKVTASLSLCGGQALK